MILPHSARDGLLLPQRVLLHIDPGLIQELGAKVVRGGRQRLDNPYGEEDDNRVEVALY